MMGRYLVGAAALAFATTAVAEPFFYSEAASGDLTYENLTTFSVGAGANRLNGVTGFGSVAQETPNFAGDRDPFALYVGQGVTINSVTLAMYPILGTIFGSEWLMVRDGDFGHPVATFRQSLSSSADYTQTWNVTLGAGTYLFHHSGLGGSFNSMWSHSWVFEATASGGEVPEPASISLVMVGVAGAGLCTAIRRRHRAAAGRMRPEEQNNQRTEK